MIYGIVLYQPWASLMAIGVKCNETRPRPWYHVGEVVICSAKLHWREIPTDEVTQKAFALLWRSRGYFPGYISNVRELYDSLPFGKALCVVNKVACIGTGPHGFVPSSISQDERDAGNYAPNRFFYPTTNCRRLKQPVPVIGRQGPFRLPVDVEAAVRAQL